MNTYPIHLSTTRTGSDTHLAMSQSTTNCGAKVARLLSTVQSDELDTITHEITCERCKPQAREV